MPVVEDIETHISRLLNQLANPNLSDREIERIERKIEILRKQRT